MSASSRCPDTMELREVLEGHASDPEQKAVIAHLDRCTSCQQSLEALANADSSLTVTLLQQAAHQTPEPNSAYWPALQEAEQAVTLAAPATSRSSGEISLAFLDPPRDGSHLGSLANFNIIRVVGRGGMGIVLHAVDTCLQRDVAIKLLDPELSKDEVAVTRFCREARAAASISHENVVAVHQVEEDESKNLPFLVMELVQGESLEKKLEREGRLPLKEIVSIGMQTAAGLAAAHEKGLIHRDIKPGNILLVNSGTASGVHPPLTTHQSALRVKLTDFGLARAAEDVRLTRSGLVAGTPLYMSPEQASGDELDARSDLFSLGVVLYELAAGEPPFTGKTPLAVLKRLTDDQPVPLGERNPDLPEWFVQIVDRLLAKNPADRFQSARAVADTLEHFWVLLKSSEKLVCPKKKASVSLWKAIILGTTAGLLTVALGAGGLFFVQPPRDRPEQKIPSPLHVFKGNSGPLWSLAVSADGKNLAMGADDGTVTFWDIAAEKVVWSRPAHKGTIWALALSPEYFATGSDDGPAKIWDLSTQKERHVLKDSAGTRALAFDADGKRLLSGERSGKVKLWDAATGEKIFEIDGHAGSLIGAVAFAPDGKTIASASGDRTIKIWDAATGQAKLTLNKHQAGVYSIAFAPSGRYLVSGSWDKTVRLWDLASGTLITTLTTPTQDVWSVDFNAQGTLFAATGEDQMVRVWDFDSKKEIAAFRASSGTILNVRFVEPGFIVAAGKGGDAQMWRLSELKSAR
jgi:eukaryotic-like serine/threonine-protein kinase